MKEPYKYFSINNINQFLKNKQAAPLKKWGQNFLIDKNVVQIIFNQFNENFKDVDYIVEIGPGLGAITYYLENLNKEVYLFEIDPVLIQNLKENNYGKNPFTLIEGDFLKNYTEISEKSFFCFGNLPYYISSDILITLVLECNRFEGGIFMLQKEFVEKIINPISSIGIFLQSFGHWNHIKNVSSSCFYPSPKTDSSLMNFQKFKNSILSLDELHVLQKILRGLFWGKRKTIQKSIKDSPFFTDLEREKLSYVIKNYSELNGTERAEDIKKEVYYELAKLIAKKIE